MCALELSPTHTLYVFRFVHGFRFKIIFNLVFLYMVGKALHVVHVTAASKRRKAIIAYVGT